VLDRAYLVSATHYVPEVVIRPVSIGFHQSFMDIKYADVAQREFYGDKTLLHCLQNRMCWKLGHETLIETGLRRVIMK